MNKKAALITGSAKRVGACIAKTLARAGCDIVIHYNESYDDAKKQKLFIEQNFDTSVEIIHQDFLNDENYERLIDFSYEKFPHICILINNASLFLQDTFKTAKKKKFDDHYKIHVKAPLFLMQSFINRIPNKNLQIINVVDDFIYKKTTKNYFSYLLSKKCMSVMTDMVKQYVEDTKMDVNVYSLFPKKILRAEEYESGELFKMCDEILDFLKIR